MSDAEYRLLIQRSFDEELSKQEHRAFVNHLETSDSGQKFHHQLDQMIQAAQDTPLPDDLRPQNPEALARMIMEQLPQKKGSIFAMFSNLFGGNGQAKTAKSNDKNVAMKSAAKKGGARGSKKGKNKDFNDDEHEAPSERRMPGVKFGRKDKEPEISAEDRENQMGTFSRLKSISTRANDAMENRDAQSTTRSLGEKFGVAGSATSNPLDEAPLTLAESIKRKVSESQKLSPLEMDSDDYSQDSSSTGGDFGRPAEQPAQDGDAWSAPSPIGLPVKQKMGAPVTAQGLDWSGAPATPNAFEQHPGSAIGLAPPGQKPGAAAPQAPSGGGLDWGSTASSANNQSGWGSNAPAMEPTAAPSAFASSSTNSGMPAAPAKVEGGWGNGWGSESQAPAPGAPVQGTGVPLKSSDSWAIPGSEAADAWGQPGQNQQQNQPAQAESAPAVAAPSPQVVAAAQNSQDPWGAAAVAGSGTEGGWSAMNNNAPAPAQGEGDNWGQAASWGAPATPTPNSTSNTLPAAAQAAPTNDPWAQPAQAAAAPAAATTSDPWAAAPAQPAAAAPVNDPWAAATAAAAPISDPWASAPAAQAAPALPNDPWAAAAAPAPATAITDPWATAAPAAADPWSAAPVAAPEQPTAPAQPINDPWAQAAAAPQAIAPAPEPAWGAPAASAIIPPAATDPAAWGAAPAPMEAPAAWGMPAQPAQNTAWSQEAEQMETGTWRAFTPKGDTLSANPPSAPAPAPAPAPAAQAPGGDRWDVPIQDRKKEASPAEAARWDVPIQSRSTSAELPAPAPVTPVGSSGIPVNQIVEKMGVVLGGSQATGDNRWDVPIQERKAQESAPAPEAPSAPTPAPEAAPSPAWGETPAPAANTWGTHPDQPSTTPWGAAAPTEQSLPVSGGWNDAPAAPAAAPGQPWQAEPAAWSAAPSPTAWGTEAPAAAPAAPAWGGTQAPAAASAPSWDQSAAPAAPAAAEDQWGQPPAWGQPAAAPAPAAAPIQPAAQVQDKANAGGMFNLGDQDIDKIFGENLGVSEPVGRGLVNTGGTDPHIANPVAAPAQAPAAAPPAQPANSFAPPAMPAPVQAAADPNAAKGLFQLTDNDLDKLFSSNLGVDEPSTQVGQPPTITPVTASNNFAPPATPPATPGWSAEPQNAPAGWGVQAPTPAPAAAAANGWSASTAAPQAPSGWGMEAGAGAGAQGPSGWSSSPAPAADAQPGGWGSPTAPTPPAWNQPAAAAPEAPKGLFSVDDKVMDRIFSDNLGIPGEQPAQQDAYSTPQSEGALPPPKIAGIGRLDAAGEQNQDAGSGRIASIGKFLLDQKDLDKIGKLTSSDLNEGKMRILTLEASQDLQSLLSQIGTQLGVVGSVIVGHDGLLIANTMPGDMDAESLGVWALGVYMNTEHVTKKMGHDRVHQVVSRTPRGYVVIADFGGGLLVTVTDGRDTDSLIPLMRTITQLVN